MSYTCCFFHIVYRTKHSLRTIAREHERELYALIWEFCKSKNVFLHRVNGMEDHLHLAVDLPPKYAVADFVRDLKTHTSMELSKNPHFSHFTGWAEGYCAISYGIEAKPQIVNYIKHQKEHHLNIKFADEIVEIIKQSGKEIKTEYFQKDWID